MANYVAAARTNYFKPKDPDALKGWWDPNWGYLAWDGDKVTCIIETDDGGFPTGEDGDLVFDEELRQHLADGEVVVMIETVHEKPAFVGGWAKAMNNKGGTALIELAHIYDLAEQLDHVGEITTAEN